MKKQGRILSGPPMKPFPNISVGQHLINHLRANGNRTYQIFADNDARVTYKEVLEKSIKLANALKSRGIDIGDRISISSENHPNYMIPVCATLFIGGVVAPLNPAYTEWELKRVLTISKPKIMFVSRLTERLFIKIAADVPWSMEVISLDDESLTQKIPTLEQILLADKTIVNPSNYKAVELGDNSRRPAAILCSSGTTGFPKGVTLSHRNLLHVLYLVPHPEVCDIQHDGRILVFLPTFHGYAFGIMLSVIVTGAVAVMMRSFNIDAFLSAIEKHKITHLTLVPPVAVLLAKHPSVVNYDFNSVKEVVCGAAPLLKDVAQKVENLLKRKIRNAYGMTELSVLTNISNQSNDVRSVGRLLPGVHCKVIDQQTHEILGAGQVGELCVKGSCVMLGYYDNTEATLQTIDEDGWLHTGDLGYFDENDEFYICGRLKELIKYKGFQVSPSEIETVLLSHSAIKEAAVIGKPDENSGELPMAFVVKQPGSSITAEEIIKYTNGKLSRQKWLRGGVRFIDNIPKNPSGKILRRELVGMCAKL